MSRSQAARLPVIVPLIVACALFMETLDATVIATALPTMARDLGESPLRLNMAITAYMLSLAVFLPLSGWLADKLGARPVFCAAIVVFTLGSIACGFSQDLWSLVLARILQGSGGALMVPVGRLVLLRSIPKTELVRAMAYFTVPALIGPVLGPPLGGFIVTYADWRWIFFINLPIGIIGILLAMRFIPDARETGTPPLDLPGFLMMGASLAALMAGFETIGRGAIPLWATLSLLVAGALGAGAYAIHARSVSHPVVEWSALKIQTFRAATLGGGLFRIGVGAIPFLLPLMLQLGFGLSAFASGLLTFATAFGALLMKPIAGPVLRALGFRKTMMLAGVMSAVSMIAMGLMRPETPHALILAILLFGGLFRSLQFTALNTLAFADITAPLMSRASTLSSVFQQVSLAFGVGLGALLLHATQIRSGVAQLRPEDFTPAFGLIALLGFVSILWFWRLPEDAGEDVSGHHAAPSADRAERTG